jgi:hypothetical protein
VAAEALGPVSGDWTTEVGEVIEFAAGAVAARTGGGGDGERESGDGYRDWPVRLVENKGA